MKKIKIVIILILTILLITTLLPKILRDSKETTSNTINQNLTRSKTSQSIENFRKTYPKASIDYFIETSLGAEYGDDIRMITKWTNPKINISYTGNLTESDKSCVSRIIEDFNSLSISSKISIYEGKGDIEMHYITRADFVEILPDATFEPNSDGFVTEWFYDSGEDRGIVYNAIILIDSTVNADLRCNTARHEIMQSLGFANDSHTYTDSVLNDDNMEDIFQFSSIDKDIIRIMYSADIQPGYTEDQVRSSLIVSD